MYLSPLLNHTVSGREGIDRMEPIVSLLQDQPMVNCNWPQWRHQVDLLRSTAALQKNCQRLKRFMKRE
jgi:hypothetical protein